MLLPTAILLLLAVVSGSIDFCPAPRNDSNSMGPELRVTFSILGWLKGFFLQPRTVAEALKAGFTSPPEETVTDIQILCPDHDPSVCIIFDQQGNIAGISLAIQRSDVDGKGYPYDKYPIFVPKIRFGYSVYVVTLFFVAQDVLASGGRASLDAGIGTGLWVQNGTTRDTLFKMPSNEKDIGNTAFTKENCVNGMGRHYYYNISESMPIEDGFFPIFGLYKNKVLIGFGLQTFGKITQISKPYYEAIPTFAIKPTIPNAPQYFTDLSIKYGIVSLHVYFVEKPWNILCTLCD